MIEVLLGLHCVNCDKGIIEHGGSAIEFKWLGEKMHPLGIFFSVFFL